MSCVPAWNTCPNCFHDIVAHQNSKPLVLQVLPDALNAGLLDEPEIGPHLVPILICRTILRTDGDQVVGANILRETDFPNLLPIKRISLRRKHVGRKPIVHTCCPMEGFFLLEIIPHLVTSRA